MRFTISSSVLNSRLQILAKAINSKSTLRVLDCFLFECKIKACISQLPTPRTPCRLPSLSILSKAKDVLPFLTRICSMH